MFPSEARLGEGGKQTSDAGKTRWLGWIGLQGHWEERPSFQDLKGNCVREASGRTVCEGEIGQSGGAVCDRTLGPRALGIPHVPVLGRAFLEELSLPMFIPSSLPMCIPIYSY